MQKNLLSTDDFPVSASPDRAGCCVHQDHPYALFCVFCIPVSFLSLSESNAHMIKEDFKRLV